MLLKFNFLRISKTTLKLSVSKWVVLDREVASVHQDEIISFCYHHTLLAAGFGDNCLSSGRTSGVCPVVPQRELDLQ